MLELMGLAVQVGPPGFAIAEPLLDGPVPMTDGHIVADRRRAIVRFPDAGTFAVEGGERVSYEPAAGAAPGAAALYLYGSIAALLLAQRGTFALHGSVVEIGGRGVAIAGPRGAGKSTTALRLAQAGHPLVTDDVSPLDTAGGVTVRPFERPVHVFPHTADTLGVDVSGAHPLTPDHVKLALPAATRGPVGVHAIAVLELSDAPGVETVRVEGAQALWHVQMNAYRIELLDALYRADVFAWSGAVARQVPVHTVRRPRAGWTIDDVAAAIEALA